MSNKRIAIAVGTTAAIIAAPIWASTGIYHVGPGQTYSSIQAAVDAAAATDSPTGVNYDGLVGGAVGGAPLPSSVQIIVHGGTYNEIVAVPADPLGQTYQTTNDNWTIAAAPGDEVWVNGGFTFANGRDSGFIDGINIRQTADSGAAYGFSGGTTRNWTVKNGIVYNDGSNTSQGVNGYLQYGGNRFNHMTFYAANYGFSLNYAASAAITDSIIAHSANVGISGYDSYGTQPTSGVSYTLFYNNGTADLVGPSIQDAGNNIFGSDPLFASVDPNSPDFLFLQPGSPAATAGQGGTYMGARGVIVTGSQWNVNADGNWSEAGNWTGGVPNAVGASATFGSIIDAAKTVTLDIPVTVGRVEFNNANAYTIAGANTLTLNDAAGSAITATAGSHTISAPVTLVSNTTVTVAQAADTLTVSGQVTGTGVTITKAGAGSLVMKNVRADGLAVDAGAVKVAPSATANDFEGTSSIKTLSIQTGASLDLANNSAVIDYTGASVQDDIRQALADGRILSSSADANKKLGYGEASATGFANGTFAGQSVDADAVLIKFTYGGDSNLDGKVDVGDLGNLASNWQQSAPWTGGDFDYNGTVNVGDLGILATNWQQGVTTPTLGPSFQEALAALGLGGVSVPEPASFGLIGLGLLGGLASRRRR